MSEKDNIFKQTLIYLNKLLNLDQDSSERKLHIVLIRNLSTLLHLINLIKIKFLMQEWQKPNLSTFQTVLNYFMLFIRN